MGHQEPAVEFLTDFEERLEVVQIQREVLHALLSKLGTPQGEYVLQVKCLENALLNIMELHNGYAESYNLYVMKLLIFKVSDCRDSRLTQSTWEAIIADTQNSVMPEQQMANISAIVSALASCFFPSEAAFPLDIITLMLEKLALENRHVISQGWKPQTLATGGVPYGSIFDAFQNLNESQILLFNVQEAVQFLSSDIAILISDWLEEAIRPQLRVLCNDFPVNLLDDAVNQYLRELDPQ
ncbi:hypothetical protein M422DRAFT_256189 [Sphaerobolus stellatus SS14]|uniref:Nucleoporin Nup133/Nup155-like C-terminal domain-containing protein n=1 Tax=Sphaerobolus stellatus (strain SS14) TaxID=990650 RepID=A0A0C9UCE7_SPHS4|nr:hypothetical protein M422DRAFT_256189 [Sphaerobolus stellatus SS14]